MAHRGIVTAFRLDLARVPVHLDGLRRAGARRWRLGNIDHAD